MKQIGMLMSSALPASTVLQQLVAQHVRRHNHAPPDGTVKAAIHARRAVASTYDDVNTSLDRVLELNKGFELHSREVRQKAPL